MLGYFENISESVFEEEDLQIETPSLHILVIVFDVRIVVDLLETWNPVIVLTKHLGQGCFP